MLTTAQEAPEEEGKEMNWSVIINYEDGTWSCDDIVCRGSKMDHGTYSHSIYDVFLGKARLGMVQSTDGYDGWSASPNSRRYGMDGKISGPLSVKGFKSRRHAIHYLLQAENYYVDDMDETLRKGTGRYLKGGVIPNPNFEG